MSAEDMLTIEVKLNGRVVAEGRLVNQSNLSAHGDYALRWAEYGENEIGIAADKGSTVIEYHRRAQSVWSLVAKAVNAILKHKIDMIEGRP